MEMDRVAQAQLLSREIHAGQIDKGGRPYDEHPAWVAERCHGDDAKIVAYLHDTIEDAPHLMSVARARSMFGEAVAGALDAITKRPGENYNDYLFRVKQNPLARAVKVLDITHNMDIRRIPNPTQKDRERVELKYGKALAYLLSE